MKPIVNNTVFSKTARYGVDIEKEDIIFFGDSL